MIENKQWEAITILLKQNIGYNTIISESNSAEELTIARAVKTNLVPLKDKKIQALIKHASCITEIQVKLYCPSLFN